MQSNNSRNHPWAFSLLFVFVALTTAAAHPMGNFSINHYSKIQIIGGKVELLYIIDLAEIPTYQQLREFDLPADSDDLRTSQYLETQVETLRRGLALESDGKAIELVARSRKIEFSEGAGGLPTMKISLRFQSKSPLSEGIHKLAYQDNNFAGRAGWKEIVATKATDAEILDSSVSDEDRSEELSVYSADLLNSPPQQLSASMELRILPLINEPVEKTINRLAEHRSVIPQAGSTQQPFRSIATEKRIMPTLVAPSKHSGEPRSDRTENPSNTPRDRFTQLISMNGKLSFWVLLSAALIAAGLGAIHALEPGHGKTIVGAYLVGSRGTAHHAVILGLVVTAAHTAGVYLLGLVVLYASRYVVPEQLYPWLGGISGLTVAGLGAFIFLRHLTGQTGEHDHVSGKSHSHWFSNLSTRPSSQLSPRSPSAQPISLQQLIALGISGGIVPCPAALVVLLSAFSLHRVGFGLFLITAFSFGLAAILVTIGLVMVYAKRLMPKIETGRNLQRYLPLLSSFFMVLLGIGIAASALLSVRGIDLTKIPKDRLLPFVTVILLGLFLGMRHSTDPDHVVAVSTIVSRQGSIKSSASIGLLWGLGHTLTIFLVGSAIIVFGVVIPPRLGLAMEFAVALMLVLLGVLNLTGTMQRLMQRFSSKEPVRATLATNLEALTPKSLITKLGVYQTFRPLIVGLVHGLAGSAAVALLVLSAIKNPFWATSYLVVFGMGTMLGMMFMTVAISVPVIYASKRFHGATRFMITTSGLVSVAFGLFLVYQIGIVDGLFAARPHWIPG